MALHHHTLGLIGIVFLLVAILQSLLMWTATLIWLVVRSQATKSQSAAAVTVLKPLCGDEFGLYENLRSFFLQDHKRYQLIFGVGNPDDPALRIVKRLTDEYPDVDVKTIICARQHGQNRKVSNLINMVGHARHDLLVMSDSDARVGREYLKTVIAPLSDPSIGLVTCIYHDTPAAGIWSRLGAMYINDWYLPSVLLAWVFGHRGFVSGQTICMSKNALKAIGGLRALANHLADDYVLGQLIRASGLRVVLSNYVPQITRHEPTLTALIAHEVRWMRTIKVLKPWGFRLLFLSFSLPMAILGAALAYSSFAPAVAGLLASVLLLRLLQHAASPRTTFHWALTDAWLIPLRDLLLAYSWYRGLISSQVSWRGAEFHIAADGIMRTSQEVQ